MSKEKKTSRPYSSEFKAEAVARCLRSSVSVTAKDLGVTATTLRDWVRRSGNDSKPGSEKMSYEELERENRRLKKEIGYISQINEILKKSTAIFSSKEMGNLR